VTPTPAGKPERSGRNRLRQAGRWLALVVAVVLAWPWRSDSSTSVILPALSPFIALASAISVRAVGILALLALPVFVLVLAYRRWFCRHGCPVGLLQEVVERFRPGARARWLKGPPIGQWLVLLTLGGAVLGYPLFLWLDPLAIFNGFLNAWRQPIALATLLTGLGLPLLLLLDLVAPRLWCRRICPLGATQDLLAGPRGFPKRRWRGKALDEDHGARAVPARSASPDSKPVKNVTPAPPIHALRTGTVRGPESVLREGSGTFGRRWFVAAIAGAAGAVVVKTVRGQTATLLRPPGSLDEQHFTGVCVRCGNCAQVCPSRIIQPDFGTSGVAGFLAPQLRFEADYCREDCHRCNEVCPSGAIARLSLEQKRRHVIGQAVVDLNLCLLAQGRECTACIQKCPYQAIALHSTDGGFSNEPRVVLDCCNGCGACEVVCPTQPVRAMRVQTVRGRG
jgi:ferredoxin-type protein NapF